MTQSGWWQRQRAILLHVPAFIPPYFKKGPERASPANQFSSPRPSDGGAMMRISLLKCLSISQRKVRPYPALMLSPHIIYKTKEEEGEEVDKKSLIIFSNRSAYLPWYCSIYIQPLTLSQCL